MLSNVLYYNPFEPPICAADHKGEALFIVCRQCYTLGMDGRSHLMVIS